MTSPGLGSGESKLETVVSYILIIGVVVSVLLEIIGISLFYRTYGNEQVSQSKTVFISGQNFFVFIFDQIQHFFGSQNAIMFMTLGLIILILTPYIRAISSVVYFAWEKNRNYVLITLFVLIVLTVSLVLH
ncbi:MAG: DUF1634 domain-containing protein [Candidatus Bathyarchaeia archaeon]|jgi:uncharacterized membrane protein